VEEERSDEEDAATLSDDEFTNTSEKETRSHRELRELESWIGGELKHLRSLKQKDSIQMWITMLERRLADTTKAIAKKKKATANDGATQTTKAIAKKKKATANDGATQPLKKKRPTQK